MLSQELSFGQFGAFLEFFLNDCGFGIFIPLITQQIQGCIPILQQERIPFPTAAMSVLSRLFAQLLLLHIIIIISTKSALLLPQLTLRRNVVLAGRVDRTVGKRLKFKVERTRLNVLTLFEISDFLLLVGH